MMESVMLRLRFRNEIRCRELNQYKQRIRDSLFSEDPLPSFATQVYITPNKQQKHTFGSHFETVQRLIREFQVSQTVFMEQEDDTVSRSSEERGRMGFATLQDLQFIANEWFRGRYACCCIQFVPQIFFEIMENHMPRLREGDSKMKRRLQRIWTVCQREMIAQLARRQREGTLQKEQKACLTTMLAYKLFFLSKYQLLEDSTILDLNLPYFNFIFHSESGFREEAPYERIAAAFLYPSPRYGLPTDGATFSAFIEISLDWLDLFAVQEIDNYSVYFLDCCIAVMEMVIKLCLFSKGHQVDHILMKTVDLGATLCKGLQGVPPQMREALLLSLLFVVSKGRLQGWGHLQKKIVNICWQCFLLPQQEVIYLWAIETLGRVRAVTALQKLQVHLTYNRCTALSREQLQHYELCMILLCKTVAELQ